MFLLFSASINGAGNVRNFERFTRVRKIFVQDGELLVSLGSLFDHFTDVGFEVLYIGFIFATFCPSGNGSSLGIDDALLIGIFLYGLGDLIEEVFELALDFWDTFA
jgi:hypothetical protein